MTWQEFARGLPHTIIALCVGSLEQHGPHLPLSVDSLIPYNLCLKLGERERLFVAPPFFYGYRSSPFTGGGQSFPVPLPFRADSHRYFAGCFAGFHTSGLLSFFNHERAL